MSVVDKLNEIAVLAIELCEEWEAEGNKDANTIASPWVFSDDENGAMDIMEWAFQVRGLAESYELCTNLDTCVICGTECPVELVRWGDHVGQLSPKQMDKQIPACKDCTQKGGIGIERMEISQNQVSYEIQHHTWADGWINTSTTEDVDGKETPLVFDTYTEAQVEMDDHFREIDRQIASGERPENERYDRSEFRIREVKENQ